jgi:RHS repeat-associated protein
VNFTLAYDAAGNMTDDGEDYEYVYDAFYRLRQVKNQSSTVLAEYRYNGLGHMIAVLEDTNASGGIDGSDVTFYPAYDEGWREVARYLGGDTSPKEQFVNATAGLDGYGRSSYINDVVLRDRDNTSGWLAASDGTLEERYYYCPNWRGDVSALVHHQRYMAEWVKYSPYGIPFGLPGGDANSDGDNDAADATQIQGWIDAPAYDVRGDVDLDGDVDGTDKALAQGVPIGGNILGWAHLSDANFYNLRAMGGYQSLPMTFRFHSRARLYCGEVGGWAQRDGLEYGDSVNLYQYVVGRPLVFVDPLGAYATEPKDSTFCNHWPWHPLCNDPTPPRRFGCQMPPACCDKIDACIDCIKREGREGNWASGLLSDLIDQVGSNWSIHHWSLGPDPTNYTGFSGYTDPNPPGIAGTSVTEPGGRIYMNPSPHPPPPGLLQNGNTSSPSTRLTLMHELAHAYFSDTFCRGETQTSCLNKNVEYFHPEQGVGSWTQMIASLMAMSACDCDLTGCSP